MLRFNIIEVINKLMGFVITALLARTLADDFGTYLYYQTIFGYLYTITLFSSDYNFLINYRINRSFIRSVPYQQTIFVKLILIAAVLLFSYFFLLPQFTKFAFWPYLVAVLASLFVYDFILYVEDKKNELVVYRFLSQAATLIGILLFYFEIFNAYYITVIQVLQTGILTFGTYLAARKYLPSTVNIKTFLSSAGKFRINTFYEISSYFLLRNFIVFFTTIEMIILTQKGRLAERDIFAEGMRLSATLMPFALFYINFNITKIKKGYYTAVTLISLLLIVISPVYVSVFMGQNFFDNTFFYNFFICVFLFTAFLEKDTLELLTNDQKKKNSLLIYNTSFFIISALLFTFTLYYPLPLLTLIILFICKLLLYYLLLLVKFKLKIRYTGLIMAFLLIIALNVILNYTGYYHFVLEKIIFNKNLPG